MILAILNDDNVCIGVSELLKNPNNAKHIEIDTYDLSLIGKQYTNGQRGTENLLSPPVEPLEQMNEKVLNLQSSLLEAQNAINSLLGV